MNRNIRLGASVPAEGALNFSHLLDAPAGVHGYTTVKNGSLYFEDGTRARFIGFNFPGGGMMPNHDTAEVYAERLASMGCNVVRLHAGDARGWSRKRRSTLDYSEEGRGRRLNEEGMDRLFYFVAQLKKRGIYVHVDLHCYRTFYNVGDLKFTPPEARMKATTIFDQQLIDLQKEYATQYLSRVNPYTGMSFLNDPVVMCIQITNENSAFWDDLREYQIPGREPYEEERRLLFNAFLLKKYGSREKLAQAWTRGGECALLPDEDPAAGTVAPIEFGDYMQPVRDHTEPWVGLRSPARYADYMECGMEQNEHYYQEMIGHVKGLGAKAPVNGCNLLHGIADIYSSTRHTDLPENNSYYNQPMDDPEDRGMVCTRNENVRTDPRRTTYSEFKTRDNHMIQQLAGAALKDKPYVISEWNEYGAVPFHSTAFLMQAAYACLQNWDGLIVYAFAGAEDYRTLPDNRIESVFSAYNDPSLIVQFGAMATMLLQNDVSEAKRVIDMCYTDEDRKMLPTGYKMPYGFLPFVSKTRTVFVGDTYRGDGDLAVNGGFASNGDFTGAKHALVYARSPYADALQHEYVGDAFLNAHRGEGAEPLLDLGTISDRSAVIDLDRVAGIEREADYTGFSRFADAAMKKWGLWDGAVGLADRDCFVSDTGEIRYDFGRGRFSVATPKVAVFSGYPEGEKIRLGPVTARIRNEKMTFSLLPRDGKPLAESEHMVLLATGITGNDRCEWDGDVLIELGGLLSADEPDGTLEVPGAEEVWALDACGRRLFKLERDESDAFVMGGGAEPALAFEVLRRA